MKTKRRQVKKDDFARILLTETATYDAPLIFSNLGFYWHWKKFEEAKSLFPELIEALLIESDPKGYTIPFHYKLRKDETSFRHLALVHPKTQINFIDFYKEFDTQILLHCSRSRFSIRFPQKIGSRYYLREKKSSSKKYRSGNVASTDHEVATRYLTSYFSYQSHTRLHRFFDSADFRRLEKKFTTFCALDIARCFDSVYTHSITWAVKNKSFSKNHRSVTNAFGSIFDRLMQSTNYNETAGIVIGPEISRIFAEIILQEIDDHILTILQSRGLSFEKQYSICRYVDDIFIFTNSDADLKIIQNVISDALKTYKFNLNSSKAQYYKRPFVTQQSRAIALSKASYKNLTDKILISDEDNPKAIRKAKFIFNRHQLLTSFLFELKSACINSPESYPVVAGYIHAVCSNLLIDFCDDHIDNLSSDDKEITRNRQLILFLMELVFHLHTLHPTSNSSLKMGVVIHRACDFFSRRMPEDLNIIRSLIYTLANEAFESGGFANASRDSDNTATLEALNLMIALRGLGDNFSLARQVIEKIVDIDKEHVMSYFEITCLLYYIGDDTNNIYKKIKSAVIRNIKSKLSDISDIKVNSEKAHLVLDILACPYLDESYQTDLISRLYLSLHLPKLSVEEAKVLRKKFLRFQWFTTWQSMDIVNTLEKKTLLPIY